MTARSSHVACGFALVLLAALAWLARAPARVGELRALAPSNAPDVAQRGDEQAGPAASDRTLDATEHAALEREPLGAPPSRVRVAHSTDGLIVPPGEVLVVRPREPGARVTGELVDPAGHGIARQEIWCVPALARFPRLLRPSDAPSVLARATTDESGRFEVPHLRRGRWWIAPAPRAEPPDHADPLAVPARPAIVVIDEGATSEHVRIEVERGLFVSGVVLDPAGDPAAGACVRAGMVPTIGWIETRARASGAFVIGPLAARECTLRAGPAAEHAASLPVRAAAGDAHVVLRLRPGARVRGVVLDAASGERCTAEIRLHRGAWSHDEERADDRAVFGSDFDFGGLPPGTYDVVARTEDGRFGARLSLELAEGEQRDALRIGVVPGGTLRVTYLGPEERALCDVRSDLGATTSEPIARGEATEIAVPAGALDVRIHSFEGLPLADARVVARAGETCDLALGRAP